MAAISAVESGAHQTAIAASYTRAIGIGAVDGGGDGLDAAKTCVAADHDLLAARFDIRAAGDAIVTA